MKKAAIEFETVIVFIIVLVVLAISILLLTKYGGSLYSGIKDQVSNIIAISNNTVTK